MKPPLIVYHTVPARFSLQRRFSTCTFTRRRCRKWSSSAQPNQSTDRYAQHPPTRKLYMRFRCACSACNMMRSVTCYPDSGFSVHSDLCACVYVSVCVCVVFEQYINGKRTRTQRALCGLCTLIGTAAATRR